MRVVFILPVVNEGERERESGYVFKWIFNVRKERNRPTSQTLVEVSPLSSLFLSCFDVGSFWWWGNLRIRCSSRNKFEADDRRK